jgi:hypothetical protein
MASPTSKAPEAPNDDTVPRVIKAPPRPHRIHKDAPPSRPQRHDGR